MSIDHPSSTQVMESIQACKTEEDVERFTKKLKSGDIPLPGCAPPMAAQDPAPDSPHARFILALAGLRGAPTFSGAPPESSQARRTGAPPIFTAAPLNVMCCEKVADYSLYHDVEPAAAEWMAMVIEAGESPGFNRRDSIPP